MTDIFQLIECIYITSRYVMCFGELPYKYIFNTFARRNYAVLKWYHVTMETRTEETECALKEEKLKLSS